MRKLTMEELNRLDVPTFKEVPKNNFVLILDSIRSLHNVGSIFRSADAFLAQKIYLCGITGTPPHREIQKTALGATESVQWQYEKDALTTIKQLKQEGYLIVALEQADQSQDLAHYHFDKNQKYAFILGNEMFGIDEQLITQVDVCLEIPQFGTKHSLNVAVSTGILLWDYFLKTQ
ncbi:MAG: TrmH family RNA methyltransferase [Cytophagales bacterium]|nr:MAG: TrmH family RNA methyltransferase [Cytophagales bacterium]